MFELLLPPALRRALVEEDRLPEFKAAGHVPKAQGQQQRSQHCNFAGRHCHIMQCVEHRLRCLECVDLLVNWRSSDASTVCV